MPLAKDLREFVELLISHRVDFLVVGAHALAFHGRPRYTGDLDLWVRASEENASRTMEVLRASGFGGLDVQSEDFMKPRRVVQLGHPPVRIDLMTGISGVDFDTAWSKRVEGELDGDAEGIHVAVAAPALGLANHVQPLSKRALRIFGDLGIDANRNIRHGATQQMGANPFAALDRMVVKVTRPRGQPGRMRQHTGPLIGRKLDWLQM